MLTGHMWAGGSAVGGLKRIVSTCKQRHGRMLRQPHAIPHLKDLCTPARRYLGNWPSTAQANNWAAQVAVTRSVDGKQPIPVNAGFLPAPPPPPLLPSVFHEIYGSGARDGRGGAPPMSPPMSPEAAMAYAAGAPPGAAGGPPLGFQPQMQPQMQPQPQYQQQQPQQPHAQQHWPDNCIQAVQQCSPFRRHRRRSRGPDGQPLPFEDPAAYGVYDPAASPVQGPGPGQAYASSPQSTQGSFTTQDQFYYQQPAGGQQQPYPYPQQPGAPGDPVAALLSTVSRTNELLRKESMARTYGLRRERREKGWRGWEGLDFSYLVPAKQEHGAVQRMSICTSERSPNICLLVPACRSA